MHTYKVKPIFWRWTFIGNLLIFLTLFCLSANATIKLYIAPQGEGTSFTQHEPGSLYDAREAIRQMKDTCKSDIELIFGDGTYHLSAAHELIATDDPVGNHKIIYRAEHPRKAIISGGREFRGWKATGKLWTMQLPEGMNFRQIYVDGSPAIRSRQPDKEKRYQLIRWDEENKTIIIDSEVAGKWQNLNQVEMVVHKHWNEDHIRIKSLLKNGDETTVVPMQPEQSMEFISSHPKRRTGQSFYFENAREFVDSPGEWYYDKQSGVLLYYPLKKNTLSSVVTVPVTETLFSLRNVHNVEIRDLVFRFTNWSQCSETGFTGSQGGFFRGMRYGRFEAFAPKTGAIRVKDAENIRFYGNLIQYTGAMGIELVSGTLHTRIKGNVFDQTGGNGVMIMSDIHGTPCKGDSILNNYFVRCASIYPGSVPLIMTYAAQTVMEHNEIAVAPYSGISAGWGWTDKITSLRGTKINYNYVHHFCSLLEDGGGIYTLSKQPDSEISNNFIEKAVASNITEKLFTISGIHLDRASQDFYIHDNIIRDVETYVPLKDLINISPDRARGKNNITRIVKYDRRAEAHAGLEPAYEYIKTWVRPPEIPTKGELTGKKHPIK